MYDIENGRISCKCIIRKWKFCPHIKGLADGRVNRALVESLTLRESQNRKYLATKSNVKPQSGPKLSSRLSKISSKLSPSEDHQNDIITPQIIVKSQTIEKPSSTKLLNQTQDTEHNISDISNQKSSSSKIKISPHNVDSLNQNRRIIISSDISNNISSNEKEKLVSWHELVNKRKKDFKARGCRVKPNVLPSKRKRNSLNFASTEKMDGLNSQKSKMTNFWTRAGFLKAKGPIEGSGSSMTE